MECSRVQATIVSREQAKSSGDRYYFTGIPCGKGHVDNRLTSTGNCIPCKRESDRLYAEANREQIKETQRRWVENNSERRTEQKVRSREKNREKRNARQREQHATDPRARLDRAMGKAIWKMLKGGKGGRSWKTLVDFSLEELVAHLELQFRDGMTWDNYGPHWHVDHIYPKSKCSFEEAWRLSNLQPLLVEENLRKGSRIEFE